MPASTKRCAASRRRGWRNGLVPPRQPAPRPPRQTVAFQRWRRWGAFDRRLGCWLRLAFKSREPTLGDGYAASSVLHAVRCGAGGTGIFPSNRQTPSAPRCPGAINGWNTNRMARLEATGLRLPGFAAGRLRGRALRAGPRVWRSGRAAAAGRPGWPRNVGRGISGLNG